MIDVNDIKKAVEEKLPLFQNGSVLTYDACELLLKLSVQDTDVLFSTFPIIKGNNRSCLYVMCQCPCCKNKFTFEATKTKIRESKKKGMGYLARQCSNLDYDKERALDNYVNIIKPENDLRDTAQICDDCLHNFYLQLKTEFDGFYLHPIRWVNTHSKDMDAWAWKLVTKLFTYPPTYDKKPDGWKYCGLRMLTQDSRHLKDVIDADFDNWKKHKEKIRPAMKVGSVQEGLKELFGDKLYSNTASIAQKKTVRIIEDTIEGLLKNTNIQSLLRHITSECTHILNKYDKFSSSSHILTFGKYRGYTVHDVIARDPEYICWALDTIEGFALDENEWAHYLGKPWKMDADSSEVYEDNESVCEDKDIERDERNQKNQWDEHS